MSISLFERWEWDKHSDDYDETVIKYSGEDMQDAYLDGRAYRDEYDRLEKENDVLKGLLAANVRVIKEEIKKELAEEENKSKE